MTGATHYGNDFISRLREIVEANFHNEQFGVTELARKMGKSRSYIHRCIKKQTNQSVSHFIRKVRLEKAMEMLLESDESASEIAFRVGFGSPAYFNHCFHEHYGFPPGEARKRATDSNEPKSSAGIPEPESGPDVTHGASRRKGKSRKTKVVWFAVSVVLLLAFFALPIYNIFFAGATKQKELAASEKSIVVLPFKNLSADTDNQYFADGITEDILNRLSAIPGLKVVSRTSAEQFRESTLDAREISRQLNVNFLLEGSVRRHDDQVRISVQFIDARNDQHIWSENYDRQMTGIFAIQSDIAQNVADALQFVLSPAEKLQMEKIPTQNTEAYNYYLMGRFFWNRRTEDGLKKSVEYFEKAIAADPDYAQAYAGLADAFFIQTWWKWGKNPEGYEKSKYLAIKALELDNNLTEAYATLGSILCYFDWDWEESRKMLKKAINLNPNYAIARQYYSELLEVLNEKEEALEQIDKAIEIDPLFFMHRILKSVYNYRDGNYNEALEVRLESEEFYPGYSSRGYNYFLIYYKLGKDQKAIESLQKILTNDTAASKYVDTVTVVYNNSGMDGILNWIIGLEQQKVPPNYLRIANWYCLLGKKEPALNWLERAVEERAPDIPRMNCNRDLNILQDEPRFIALIEKMGLTPYANLSEK